MPLTEENLYSYTDIMCTCQCNIMSTSDKVVDIGKIRQNVDNKINQPQKSI